MNESSEEPDLGDLAWEFDRALQKGQADSIADWLAVKSVRVTPPAAGLHAVQLGADQPALPFCQFAKVDNACNLPRLS